MPVCDSMWAGRCKRDVKGNPSELKGRCVIRGDLQASFYNLTPNQTMSPVVRNTLLGWTGSSSDHGSGGVDRQPDTVATLRP